MALRKIKEKRKRKRQQQQQMRDECVTTCDGATVMNNRGREILPLRWRAVTEIALREFALSPINQTHDTKTSRRRTASCSLDLSFSGFYKEASCHVNKH